MRITGTIVKGIAGFYYVKTEDGTVYQCKARGIFKKDGIVPAVGDRVEITVQQDGDAVVERIFSRINVFSRPPIANVETFVIVTAAKNPDPSPGLVDKFLVMAEKNHTEILLCVNKIDLADAADVVALCAIYEGIYPVYPISAAKRQGLDVLEEALAGKQAALAGPSGAGKSTLLNALIQQERMETGHVSSKTGRGRHTTRHAELFEMRLGGSVFDTPGFTSFDLPEMEESELEHCYPEFSACLGKCRYDNCRHLKEPGCAVRESVSQGNIRKERYRSYAAQLLEIREKEKNRYG